MLGAQVSPSNTSAVTIRNGAGSGWSVRYVRIVASDRAPRLALRFRIGLITAMVSPGPVSMVSGRSSRPGTAAGTAIAATSATAAVALAVTPATERRADPAGRRKAPRRSLASSTRNGMLAMTKVIAPEPPGARANGTAITTSSGKPASAGRRRVTAKRSTARAVSPAPVTSSNRSPRRSTAGTL